MSQLIQPKSTMSSKPTSKYRTNRFKQWLIKKLLGEEVIEFVRLATVTTQHISSQMASMQESQAKTVATLKTLSTNCPPNGWVEILQNAVVGLDRRLEILATILADQERSIQELTKVWVDMNPPQDDQEGLN